MISEQPVGKFFHTFSALVYIRNTIKVDLTEFAKRTQISGYLNKIRLPTALFTCRIAPFSFIQKNSENRGTLKALLVLQRATTTGRTQYASSVCTPASSSAAGAVHRRRAACSLGPSPALGSTHTRTRAPGSAPPQPAPRSHSVAYRPRPDCQGGTRTAASKN